MAALFSSVELREIYSCSTAYNLDLMTGKLQTNEPAARFQRLRNGLGVTGMLSGLFRSSFIGQGHRPEAYSLNSESG